MKAKMLKIAGVKSEKEFYKKYPSEEAFMKAHGKEFKKAAMGAKMVKTQLQQLTDFGNPPQAQGGIELTGMTGTGNYNFIDPNTPITASGPNYMYPQPSYSGLTGLDLTAPENKIDISKQTGYKQGAKPISGMKGGMNINSIIQTAGDIYGGVNQMVQENKAKKKSETWKKVSDVQLQAANTRPERIKNKYSRPEDVVINPEQAYPSYGTGYNPGFAARNGSVIRAQGGMQIGGNPTEIQNTYAPTNTLYDDLGYEPLNDSSQLKQYYGGGMIPTAAGGYSLTFGETMNTGGGKIGGAIGGAIGGPVGKLAGTFIGGVLGSGAAQKEKTNRMKTQENYDKIMGQNFAQGVQNQYSAYVEDGGTIPQHEEGGWVSHDWQPQVISQFDGVPIKSLLTKDPMMDTLRTGGRITQNNIYPQDQYALGGSLKTTWGGHAETISQNPYDESETIMFRGKSHAEGDGNGHTGIGVKYGDNQQHDSYTDYAEYGTEQADADVEVERGEPATEMLDPQTGEKNMVVFGNLKIPNRFVDLLGDPKAKNKKFKNYVNTLAKIEEKQNKKIDKASREIDELDVYTPFDKLKLDSLKANLMGANLTLKEASDKKKKASGLQNAINDTAAEFGVDADALAKGKIKVDKEAMKEQAKWGAKMETAQAGLRFAPQQIKKPEDLASNLSLQSTLAESLGVSPTNIATTSASTYNIPASSSSTGGGKKKKSSTSSTSSSSQPSGYVSKFGIKPWKGNKFGLKEKTKSPFTAEEWDGILENLGFTGSGNKEAEEFLLNDPRSKDIVIKRHKDLYGRDPWIDPEHFGYGWSAEDLKNIPQKLVKRPDKGKLTATITPAEVGTEPIKTVTPNKRDKKIDFLNQLLPFIRPSDQEPLDPRQLTGEMYALSNNQEEAVKAEGYQPQLLTPYDISLQDQLNEVTAQSRAAERMAGNNPAAAMAIAAQANEARNKILGEQMRINQGQRMGTYNQNIATINDAKLKNLGIYDQQYQRQSQAKSATKAVTQAALSSIADKYAKHEYENRSLGIYENLYNYRYDKDGRAINMNPLQQFDVAAGSEKGGSGTMPNAPEGYEWDPTPRLKKKKEDESAAKNGAKIKSRNGSIVRAIKNL